MKTDMLLTTNTKMIMKEITTDLGSVAEWARVWRVAIGWQH